MGATLDPGWKRGKPDDTQVQRMYVLGPLPMMGVVVAHVAAERRHIQSALASNDVEA